MKKAVEQVLEAQQAIQLYRDSLLPAAEQTVDATRANYDVGKTTFLNLLTAQTQTLMQREQYQQALAAYHSRLADLERAIGGPLPEMAARESVPVPRPANDSGTDNSRQLVPAHLSRASTAPRLAR